MKKVDVLIIGCGIAGAVAALELAAGGAEVVVVCGEESNSMLAQGGVIWKGVGDSKELLVRDIEMAGAGLCHRPAVEQLAEWGPRLVEEVLIGRYGIPFDREGGELKLTREAAHGCPRVIYHKDQTGRAIMETLLEKIKGEKRIELKRGCVAVDLITLSHHSKRQGDIYHPSTCVGAYVMEGGQVEIYFARETILATGGLGEVFLHTSNPKEARGDGVAMAYRAGARIMNMEYIQFHPTTFYQGGERRFLLSEALRGEGAELLSWDGKPFMHRYHEKGTLAPRDVVSRSVYQEMVHAGADHLWLDLSFKEGGWIRERFPFIHSHCLSKGFDLTREPIPIVPAAHYCCGGIAVDLGGQTTIQRLRAIGEVSCTGVHGANRLASTALLEGLVWAKRCSQEILERLPNEVDYFPPVEEWVMSSEPVDKALIQQDWLTIKQTMWNYVGLIRDKGRLTRALKMLQELKWEIESFYERCQLTPELLGLRNGVQTALLITQGALRNKHSVGSHHRLN